MLKLTEKQEELYNYIISRLIETSRIPSLSEIAESLDLDKRSVFQFLSSLEKKGAIKKSEDGKIELNDKDRNLIISKRIEKREGGFTYFPIQCKDPSSYFSFQIQSDEMKNIGLLPGDEGIFKRTDKAESSSIVLCRVGEEDHLMLRRLLIRSDGFFELIPENDSMGKAVAESIVVEGVLIASRRSYGK